MFLFSYMEKLKTKRARVVIRISAGAEKRLAERSVIGRRPSTPSLPGGGAPGRRQPHDFPPPFLAPAAKTTRTSAVYRFFFFFFMGKSFY